MVLKFGGETCGEWQERTSPPLHTMATLACIILFCVAAVQPLAPRSDREGIRTVQTIPAPRLQIGAANFQANLVPIEWTHDTCYKFDVRAINAGSTNTETLYFHGLLMQGKHTFSRKMKFSGRTSFTVRAIQGLECSEWSSAVEVIP